MPIYEFYCPDCNTIYSFLSRSVNTEKNPACPGCRQTILERKVSRFAVSSGSKNSEATESDGNSMGDETGKLPFDEAKMEKAMETLAGEAGRIDENDPRAAANLMRKLSDMTGLQYGDKMQEAIKRMESGEDPESIEAELGSALENEEPFVMPGGSEQPKSGARKRPPLRDDTLYEM